MDNPMGGNPLTGPGNMPSAPVAIARAGRVQLGDPMVMPDMIRQPGLSGPVAGIPGMQNAQGVESGAGMNMMDGMGLNIPRPMMGGQVVDITGMGDL
jgi:hypothetical protein